MQNVQNRETSLVTGDGTLYLWGKGNIEEHINDVVFDLSLRTFFQLDPERTEILYNKGTKASDLQSNETVVGAYCGVGTIGLSLTEQTHQAHGTNIIPAAVGDTRFNAKRPSATNTCYTVGIAEDLLPEWFKEGSKPDAIVVDPPRVDLDRKLLTTLLKQPPKKMMYISCNVSTLVRDLVQLAKAYQVNYLQSADIFPQTAHYEVVVELTRK